MRFGVIGGQAYLSYGFDIVIDKMDTNGLWKDSSAVSMNDNIVIFCYLKNQCYNKLSGKHTIKLGTYPNFNQNTNSIYQKVSFTSYPLDQFRCTCL